MRIFYNIAAYINMDKAQQIIEDVINCNNIVKISMMTKI